MPHLRLFFLPFLLLLLQTCHCFKISGFFLLQRKWATVPPTSSATPRQNRARGGGRREREAARGKAGSLLYRYAGLRAAPPPLGSREVQPAFSPPPLQAMAGVAVFTSHSGPQRSGEGGVERGKEKQLQSSKRGGKPTHHQAALSFSTPAPTILPVSPLWCKRPWTTWL